MNRLKTVGEILRTLRTELRQHQKVIREGKDVLAAVSIEQRHCAIEALRFAIQHIQKHRLTVDDLKRAILETLPPAKVAVEEVRPCNMKRMSFYYAKQMAKGTSGRRYYCKQCDAWHVDAVVNILPKGGA